jgi:site-specific DNA-methyltransferase (adenine-specific)
MEVAKNIFYLNEDCMAAMARYPDKYFDVAIVDPPYGLGEDGRKSKGRGGMVRQWNGSEIYVSADKYAVKNWDNMPPSQEYFDELFRVSKKQIIWGENYMDFTQKSTSSGRIIWDKVNTGDFSDCEIAWTNLFSSTRQIEYMWNGFMQGKSLEEGRRQQGNKQLNEKRIHPTQKPKLLYKWIYNKFIPRDSKILDTHHGSGNNGIVAHIHGVAEFIGTDTDPEYWKESIDNFKEIILF